MSVRHTMYVVKCPTKKCQGRIRLSEGRFVGGVNDKGGVVIECEVCKKPFPCRLSNPNDASGVTQGGRVLERWTEEMPAHIEQQYGISAASIDGIERLIVFGYEKPPKQIWEPAITPLYEANGVDFEATAEEALEKHLAEINDEFYRYKQVYVKGGYDANKSFIIIDYEHNSQDCRAVFAKQIETEEDLNTDNLYLIHHSHVDLEHQIDGIYTRDDILVFLERLLNRWRYTASETLLVVPFIGFQYKNAEEALQELWEWILRNVDQAKTKLITRKVTVNMFRNAQINSGVPFDDLIEWGLVEPLVDAVSQRGATFQPSHAKYYVGIFEDYVEVLTGSFNIHEGKYFENVSFRRYDKGFFMERYLHMFSKYSYPDDEGTDEQVHYMIRGRESHKNWVIGLRELTSEIIWPSLKES